MDVLPATFDNSCITKSFWIVVLIFFLPKHGTRFESQGDKWDASIGRLKTTALEAVVVDSHVDTGVTLVLALRLPEFI